MRLSRTDLVPMLAIIGGGAFGVLTFGSFLLLWSPFNDVTAPDPVVAPLATANSAIGRLEQAQRRLVSTDVEMAWARAADLAREQREMEADMERLGEAKDGPGSEAVRRVFDRKQAMLDEIADLEREIDRLATDYRADQPDVADRLREATTTIRDDKLKERIRYSRGLIGVQDREYTREFEAETTRILEELQQELQRASDAAELAAPAQTAPQEIRPEDAAAILAGPVFTPMMVRPEVTNRDEVQAALMREYPAALRDSGIGGRAVVWFYVSETGRNLDNRISRSSGQEQFDQAALRVAAVFQFTPAMNPRQVRNSVPLSQPVIRVREVPVAVWIQIPITFAVPEA